MFLRNLTLNCLKSLKAGLCCCKVRDPYRIVFSSFNTDFGFDPTEYDFLTYAAVTLNSFDLYEPTLMNDWFPACH